MFDKIDKVIFYITLVLIFLGVVFVFSSSYYVALNFNVYPYYFSLRQLLWAVIAVVAMLIFAKFDYKLLKKYVKPMMGVTILLLLAVFIPGIGKSSGGAQRWINLGFFLFNPSEMAKIVVLIYLSYILTKKQAKLENFTFGLLPPLLLVAGMFFVILMQTGFSMAAVLLFVSFIMFFIGGASTKHILSIGILSLPVLAVFIGRVGYRLDRVLAFIDPWKDPTRRGYQIIQSLKAFAEGGFFGKGLGNSTQKMIKLPTPHTDYIFSIIVEEIGAIGGIVILALFFAFFIRGIVIAFNCKDKFGQLLSFGIVSLITMHAMLNIGIAVGLMPPTGISLPFISYGGSSMLVMAIGVGILLNISSQNEMNVSVDVKEIEDIIQEGF